jgi:hypothetical protein
MPKGEKVLAQSKRTAPPAKGPHHHQILKTYDFPIDISLCSKRGEKVVFSKLMS